MTLVETAIERKEVMEPSEWEKSRSNLVVGLLVYFCSSCKLSSDRRFIYQMCCSSKAYRSIMFHNCYPSHSAFCEAKIMWSTVLWPTGRNGLHGDIN